MSFMEANSGLTVNEQSISIPQAFTYLQVAGKLQGFITEILRQHVIANEFQTRDDLAIDPFLVEQALVNFRVERQLIDSKVFQEWLESNGPVYTGYRTQTVYRLKLEKLKALVTEPRLQEYFFERKIFLDHVVLSQIVVDDLELAEELQSQILEGNAAFEQLAREYSLAEDRIVNGMMGPISRGRLNDALRSVIDSVSPGNVVGPIQIKELYCLFRVEQFLPATLEGKLQAQLQNEIFEQWLAEKMQKMNVKVQGN